MGMNNTWLDRHQIIKESDNYFVIRNSEAKEGAPDEDNYFLVLKQYLTVEAKSHAYVIILMHMLDAESAYASVMDNLEGPKIPKSTTDARPH